MPTTWTTVTDIIKLADHKLRHQKSGADEISLTGLEGTEIRLTPKASSTGAEGTIFYDSDDDHIWVGTE